MIIMYKPIRESEAARLNTRSEWTFRLSRPAVSSRHLQIMTKMLPTRALIPKIHMKIFKTRFGMRLLHMNKGGSGSSVLHSTFLSLKKQQIRWSSTYLCNNLQTRFNEMKHYLFLFLSSSVHWCHIATTSSPQIVNNFHVDPEGQYAWSIQF